MRAYSHLSVPGRYVFHAILAFALLENVDMAGALALPSLDGTAVNGGVPCQRNKQVWTRFARLVWACGTTRVDNVQLKVRRKPTYGRDECLELLVGRLCGGVDRK